MTGDPSRLKEGDVIEVTGHAAGKPLPAVVLRVQGVRTDPATGIAVVHGTIGVRKQRYQHNHYSARLDGETRWRLLHHADAIEGI